VGGRNPAPVDRWFIPLFIGFQQSFWVRDFATIHTRFSKIITQPPGPLPFSRSPGFSFNLILHKMLGDEGLPLNAVMAKGATSDLRHGILEYQKLGVSSWNPQENRSW